MYRGSCFVLIALVLAPCIHGQECRRIGLEDPPSRTADAAWSLDGDELLLVTMSQGELLRYDATGRLQGKESHARQPTSIRRVESGYLLRDGTYQWLWLDEELEVEARTAAPPDGFFQMIEEEVVGSELYGLGVFRREGEVETAFLRVRVKGEPELLAAYLEVDRGSKNWGLYTLQDSLVAVVEDAAYALVNSSPPHVVELREPVRTLEAFPAGFEEIPELPESRGPSTDVARYWAFERAKVAVGLYGGAEHLFVLTRNPWRLHRLDPASDRLLASFEIPTNAAHLTVAPGPREWAFIEKGPHRGDEGQEIPTALLVPKTDLEGPLPADRDDPVTLCNGM